MIEKLIRSRHEEDVLRSLGSERYDLGLDLGCGDGRLAKEMSARCDKVIGIELDPKRVQRFKQQGIPKSYHLELGDATNLPIKNDTFDLISSVTVVEHIPRDQLEAYFSEIYRVAKVGATVYIVNDTLMYRFLRRSRLLFPNRGPDPSHVSMMTPNNLARLANRAGLHIIRVESSPFRDWIVPDVFPFRGLGLKGHILAKKAAPGSISDKDMF